MLYPKPLPRAITTREDKRTREREASEARRIVRERDRYRCRACGTAGSDGNRVDVHHLKFRSRGGVDSPENLLCLCRCCHSLVHSYRLFIVGEDANGTVRFERQRL